MHEIIPFGKAKIDSFSLLLPFECVNVVSNTFLQKYSKCYIESTGELEDSEKFYNDYEETFNSDSLTFLKYKKVERKWNDSTRIFIQIMITSKLLKSNYFTGININNIANVYDYLIKDGIISISFLDFVNGFVTDVDLCKDYALDIDGFKELKEMLLKYSISEKSKYLHTKAINSKDGVFGIQFSERHKATPTKPFMKLYYKTAELKVKKIKKKGIDSNLRFYDVNLSHLKDLIELGISRFEVTIKNYRHKEKLGITGVKTLDDLLGINEAELSSLFDSIVSEYYNKIEVVKEKTERLQPMDLMLNNALEFILKTNKGMTKEELVFVMTQGAYDRKQKSIIKLKTLEVLNSIWSPSYEKAISSSKSEAKEVMKDLKIFGSLN